MYIVANAAMKQDILSTKNGQESLMGMSWSGHGRF